MKIIFAYDGTKCYLSDEIYELVDAPPTWDYDKYVTGTKVRLISGIDGSNIPGYHFSKGYVTVCRSNIGLFEDAEFLGFKKSQIRLIST